MITGVVTAFSMGILGAGHCIAMCGGIASAMSVSTDDKKWQFLLCYNIGRLLSYGLFGALAASLLAQIAIFSHGFIWLRAFSAILLICLGLYIGRYWHGLVYLERLGRYLWRYLAPIAQKLLPLKNPLAALGFGFIWGWLPCGMVYTALTAAALSSNSLHGFVIMLAFGVGTLPAMLVVGGAAEKMKQIINHRMFRALSALTLILYGFFTLSLLFLPHH